MREAIVITGASAGIGRATAEVIAETGCQVLNLDRDEARATTMQTYCVDLADRAALGSVLAEIDARFHVVGLVNNVGFAQARPLEDTDDEFLDRTFDLNLRCAVQCARTLLAGMRQRRYGRIVNVSSRSALGRELRTAYAASKGGLIAMTRVWALELARSGITANCVAPGPIATDLFDEMNPVGSGRRDAMIGEIPVGRIGTPRDVARAIRFFLSPDAGFVTGQTLYVCGGLSVGVAPL